MVLCRRPFHPQREPDKVTLGSRSQWGGAPVQQLQWVLFCHGSHWPHVVPAPHPEGCRGVSTAVVWISHLCWDQGKNKWVLMLCMHMDRLCKYFTIMFEVVLSISISVWVEISWIQVFCIKVESRLFLKVELHSWIQVLCIYLKVDLHSRIQVHVLNIKVGLHSSIHIFYINKYSLKSWNLQMKFN